MHQRVGQIAIRRQQQQASGVDVESPHRNPACALDWRQAVEYGRASLWIFARGQLAFWLVIDDGARWLTLRTCYEAAAIKFDAITTLHAAAKLSDRTVDLDLAIGDALFQRASRAKASSK